MKNSLFVFVKSKGLFTIQSIWNLIFLIAGNTTFPSIVFIKNQKQIGFPCFDFFQKLDRNFIKTDYVIQRNKYFKKLISLKYLLGYFFYICFTVLLVLSYFKIAINLYYNTGYLPNAVFICCCNIFFTIKLWVFAKNKMIGFIEHISLLEISYICYLMKSQDTSNEKNREIIHRIYNLGQLTRRILKDREFVSTVYIYKCMDFELKRLAIEWREEANRKKIVTLFLKLNRMYFAGYFGSIYEKLSGKTIAF